MEEARREGGAVSNAEKWGDRMITTRSAITDPYRGLQSAYAG